MATAQDPEIPAREPQRFPIERDLDLVAFPADPDGAYGDLRPGLGRQRDEIIVTIGDVVAGLPLAQSLVAVWSSSTVTR